MRCAVRRAALLMFLCCALSAQAAEDSESQDPPRADETDAEDSRGADAAAAEPESDAETPPGESPEIFIPSEDISESIAVKFPVDI